MPKGIPKSGFNKGWLMTSEQRKKISDTCKRKGLKPPITHRFDEKNPAWKGGGYDYIHDWIVRVVGRADKCEKCGKIKTTYNSIQWANIDHKYKRNREDWKKLCASCHKLNDINLKKHES